MNIWKCTNHNVAFRPGTLRRSYAANHRFDTFSQAK